MAIKKTEARDLVLLAIICGAIWLFQEHTALICTSSAVVIALYVLAMKPSSCQLCGSALKRTVYKWEIDGKNKHVCFTCNSGLGKKNSKEAISQL